MTDRLVFSRILPVVALLAALGAFPAGMALAQDAATDAAVAAANQAKTLVPPSVLEELDTAWAGVQKAKAAYDEAMLTNNQALLNQRWEDIKQAHTALYRAENKADEVRVQALSRTSGRSAAEIQAMREAGKGWGVIAKDLGVPASSLGLGHGRGDPVERAAEKAKRDKEMEQDKDRDKDQDRDKGKGKDKGPKDDKGGKEKSKDKSKGKSKGKAGV